LRILCPSLHLRRNYRDGSQLLNLQISLYGFRACLVSMPRNSQPLFIVAAVAGLHPQRPCHFAFQPSARVLQALGPHASVTRLQPTNILAPPTSPIAVKL